VSLFVVDASVAAKWCLPPTGEPLSTQALRLLADYAAGQVRFVVPDLFWAELGNLLWKAVRLGRCAKSHAESALDSVLERGFSTVSSVSLLAPALAIASSFDRSVYDCLYVALAVHSKAHFLTADERLANSLAAHLPVKWLGTL